MEKKHSEEREQYIEKMVKHLPVLRATLRLKQWELAEKVGVTRQTIVDIENHKRVLPWSLYLAFVLVFQQYMDSKILLDRLELFDGELINCYVNSFQTVGERNEDEAT